MRTLPLFAVRCLCAALLACTLAARSGSHDGTKQSSSRRTGGETLTVLTLNTKHGGEPPWSAADQIAAIVAERPDVVFLQEAAYTQVREYVDGINAGLGTTAWHGDASRHCRAGSPHGCTRLADESVMILSRFAFADSDRHLIWSPDDAWVARAVMRARILTDAGVPIQAFSVHLPAGEQHEGPRREWTRQFNAWARPLGGAQIAGGDFNDGPSSRPVALMKRTWTDAWAVRGRGSAGTETEDDRAYTNRFDYLFAYGPLRVERAFVRPVRLSDHRPLVAVFRLAH